MARNNGSNSIIIARIRDIIKKILEKLGKGVVFVNVYHVFYSPLMKDTGDRYRFRFESMDIHQQLLSTSLTNMVSG